MFAAPDNFSNLATTITPYAEQGELLLQSKWEYKAIRLVFFGDYELLCCLYGLSGASSRPCMFCLATKTEMQDCLAHPAQQRSLASLRNDHQAFQADGFRLPRATFFNNVIRPNLLTVDLDWVCVCVCTSPASRPWHLSTFFEARVADWR